MPSEPLKALAERRNPAVPASGQSSADPSKSGPAPAGGPGSPRTQRPPLSRPADPAYAMLSGPSPFREEASSPEAEASLQERRAAEGLRLLRNTPEYRRLLVWPATCYEPEIQELRAAGTWEIPKDVVSNWHAVMAAILNRKGDLMKGVGLVADSWADQNLWAIPVPEPNNSARPYSLAWCLLPPGLRPLNQSEWQVTDPVTGTQGPILLVSQPAFPVPPDLWQEVAVGAFLSRRVFLVEPAEPPEA